MPILKVAGVFFIRLGTAFMRIGLGLLGVRGVRVEVEWRQSVPDESHEHNDLGECVRGCDGGIKL